MQTVTTLPGVRVGPLDPDAAENFGHVGASNAARKLLRHHGQMIPPELLRALQGAENEARTKTLVTEEVAEAMAGVLPEDVEVTGVTVRGAEDKPQFLCFTYLLPSGRNSKAAIEYDADRFPESYKAGTDLVQIEKAQEAGMPWIPRGLVDVLAGAGATGQPRADSDAADDAEALRRENDDLRRRMEELERSSQTAAPIEPQPEGEAPSAELLAERTEPDGGDEDGDPEQEPWDGYSEMNADDIARRLREEGDAEAAEVVMRYETAHANRSTVTNAANAILDRREQ